MRSASEEKDEQENRILSPIYKYFSVKMKVTKQSDVCGTACVNQAQQEFRQLSG